MKVYTVENVGSFWYNRIRAKMELLELYPEAIKDFKNNMLSEGIYNSFKLHTTEFLHIVEIIAFPEGIPDYMQRLIPSPTKGNPNTLRFYNHQTTLADIEYVYMVKQLEKEMRQASVICEIGAGYGGLADKLLRAKKAILCYTLIDFEPHRKLQKYFLGPDVRVKYKTVNTFPQEPLDLVINTRSMMEMDLEEIKFYIDQIQKWLKPGGLFYLITKDKVTKFKDYPLDKHWKTEKAVQFPTPNRVPMVEYFLRRTLY